MVNQLKDEENKDRFTIKREKRKLSDEASHGFMQEKDASSVTNPLLGKYEQPQDSFFREAAVNPAFVFLSLL